MLRSLLPSRAFNRHFQKTEWAAVPPPSLSPRSFPFAVLQSIFGGQREPLKINHLGLKTPFPMSYSLLCLCVWLESQSRQSECGMSRKAGPSVGLRQGRGWAEPVAPPFSPRPLLKRGAGGGRQWQEQGFIKNPSVVQCRLHAWRCGLDNLCRLPGVGDNMWRPLWLPWVSSFFPVNQGRHRPQAGASARLSFALDLRRV